MTAQSRSVVHPDDLDARPGESGEVRVTFDATNGCERLEQRVSRLPPGSYLGPELDGRQAVVYVVSGAGTIEIDGRAHPLEPGTGVFLAPGETSTVVSEGPPDLELVSVYAAPINDRPSDVRKITVRFGDQPELEASSERTFRYLVNEEAGCMDLTQFVGIVQPSKAPFHSHPYDEVGCVIEGEGVAHVDDKEIPLRAGSCFHLAPGQVHCIENSGDGPMRILGVFYPAGSPASRI